MQSSQAGVGVGYANTGCLSACPFRGSRAARCFLHTHPHSCRVQRTWRVEPSQQVSHTLACVCIWSWNFPRDTLTHSSLLLSSVLLSSFSFPLLQHTFVLFSLPLFLSPPSSASLVFPSALSYVLRLWLVCEVKGVQGEMLLMLQLFGLHVYLRAHWETRLHVSRGTSTQHSEKPTTITFYPVVLSSQLHFQDSGIKT